MWTQSKRNWLPKNKSRTTCDPVQNYDSKDVEYPIRSMIQNQILQIKDETLINKLSMLVPITYLFYTIHS